MLCRFEIYGAFDEGWALLLASSSGPMDGYEKYTSLGVISAAHADGELQALQAAPTPALLCTPVNDCRQHSPLAESGKHIYTRKTGMNWAALFPVYSFLGLMAVLNTGIQSTIEYL